MGNGITRCGSECYCRESQTLEPFDNIDLVGTSLSKEHEEDDLILRAPRWPKQYIDTLGGCLTDSPCLSCRNEESSTSHFDVLDVDMKEAANGAEAAPVLLGRRASEVSSVKSSEALTIVGVPSALTGPRHHRPPIQVVLRREPGSMAMFGMRVSPDDSPCYLVIDEIAEGGLAAKWNAAHGEDKQVAVGDLITSVNGVEYDSEAMIKTIRGMGKGAKLRLRVE
mmetsp:Transcript_28168/g.59638  ORF Transcript_28168/g.59638 Transcript_28168/m.59638 type:complete len:224 (+) Transcript_28168:49-720(+)